MEFYYTQGTCSKQILFEVKDNKLAVLRYAGGCNGNNAGIASLVLGKEIDEIIEKFKGISCRNGTSCPDQLAQALIKYKQKVGG